VPARRRSPGGYRIPLEHLRWYAAFHRKEDSVHIHMVVFSSNLKEGYLTKQGIRQVKSAFGRRIFRQDLLHIYEQKTEYRDALGRDAERTMAELIAQMETGQLQNENLEQPILELSRRLQNTKGKTVYGYLPPTTCGTRCGRRCTVPTQNNCRSACPSLVRRSSKLCVTRSSGRCSSWSGGSIPQQMR